VAASSGLAALGGRPFLDNAPHKRLPWMIDSAAIAGFAALR